MEGHEKETEKGEIRRGEKSLFYEISSFSMFGQQVIEQLISALESSAIGRVPSAQKSVLEARGGQGSSIPVQCIGSCV